MVAGGGGWFATSHGLFPGRDVFVSYFQTILRSGDISFSEREVNEINLMRSVRRVNFVSNPHVHFTPIRDPQFNFTILHPSVLIIYGLSRDVLVFTRLANILTARRFPFSISRHLSLQRVLVRRHCVHTLHVLLFVTLADHAGRRSGSGRRQRCVRRLLRVARLFAVFLCRLSDGQVTRFFDFIRYFTDLYFLLRASTAGTPWAVANSRV